MYAIDDLSDAVDVTEELLTPVDARFWLKLVVVAFFVSGAGFGLPSIPTTDGTSVRVDPAVEDAFGEAGVEVPMESLLALLALVVAVGLAIWLVLTLIRAAMEFVLVDALVSGEVHIRAASRRYAGRALSLFAFILVASVLVFAPVALAGYRAYVDAGSIEALSLSSLAGLAAAGAISTLAYTVVIRLTTALVVPIMYAADVGVLAGWRRLAGLIRSDPAEYAVYLTIATIAGFVAAILVTTILAIAMVVVAVPFVLLGVVSLLLGPLALPAIVLLLFLFVVALVLCKGAIELPVVVYLRYYALFVLGDTDERYDLVPDRRRRVRAGDAWAGGQRWDRDGADEWDADSAAAAESDAGTESDATGEAGRRRGQSDGHGWDVGSAPATESAADESTDDAEHGDGSAGHGWDGSDRTQDRTADTTEEALGAEDDAGTEDDAEVEDDDRSGSDGWSYRDEDR
ncbi:DUF7544 domain-containing protein [Halovivax limisalsi]|uniref:DUF7544 domain-containing protein n=1 Tax=Halovivax limisalsi TaxID=1453760 RepID=UPI001FFC3289|nr:hypothetical protein [Halovivax limisalsi]